MFYVDHLWKDALHVLTIDALEICMAAFHQEIKICMHFVNKHKRVSPILHVSYSYQSLFLKDTVFNKHVLGALFVNKI